MVKIPRAADRSFSDFLIGIELWNFILLWIRIAETKVTEKHNKKNKKNASWQKLNCFSPFGRYTRIYCPIQYLCTISCAGSSSVTSGAKPG